MAMTLARIGRSMKNLDIPTRLVSVAKRQKIRRLGYRRAPWKMILSLLSRKWVAKESGGVRWSTQWSRRKTLRPGVSRDGLRAGQWVTPLVGGVFAFGSTGGRCS